MTLTCNVAVAEDALLEYCFGVCDEQYATRQRFLYVTRRFLNKDFLQRWVEVSSVNPLIEGPLLLIKINHRPSVFFHSHPGFVAN